MLLLALLLQAAPLPRTGGSRSAWPPTPRWSSATRYGAGFANFDFSSPTAGRVRRSSSPRSS